MKKTNTLQITDLIFESPEEHDLELENAIKASPEYAEAAKNLEEHRKKLDELDKRLYLDIDDDYCRMEVISRDIAFNEGFKLAVKLILSSIQ